MAAAEVSFYAALYIMSGKEWLDEIAAGAGAIRPADRFLQTLGNHRHQLARAERFLEAANRPELGCHRKEIGCGAEPVRNDMPDMTTIGRSASARAPDG
jgi:hypothetical protein